MNLTTKDTNWGAVAAIVAFLTIAAYDFMVPKPGLDPKAKTLEELERERATKREQYAKAQTEVDGQTWQVGRDEVGPKAMAWVSRAAEANFVSISAFRPQKMAESAGLDQLNYMVTAEGPFLNVMRLIDAIESEGSLMAVKSVQLASVNGASDTVRATVGLVAFKEAAAGG